MKSQRALMEVRFSRFHTAEGIEAMERVVALDAERLRAAQSG